MVLEKRTYHPIFVCSAQVNVETAFLCNGAALVSQSFTFLICHSEGFAHRAPFVVDVTTCANFNVERGHGPTVPFDYPFEFLVFPEFLEMPIVHVLFPWRSELNPHYHLQLV